MKYFIVILMSLTAKLLFADTLRLNRETITQKTYSCSNGGTLVLQNTRFGNVKKVIFSKPGHTPQYNYVNFWNMTDYYKGKMVTWLKIPSGPIKDDLQQGRSTAEMTIQDDGSKFIMTVTPIRIQSGFNEFSCVGL